MPKLIKLMSIIMMCLALSDAVDLRYKITNNIVKIFYDNPCLDLGSIFTEPEPIYATDHMECNYGFKYRTYSTKQCNKHYTNNWLAALHELDRCQIPNQRGKRSVSSLFSHPYVVTAATNLIKSLFTTGDSKELVQRIKNDYKISNVLNINSMNDVYTDSNNVYSHPLEANQSNQVPRPIRALNIVHKGIATKSALVRIIAHECRRTGQLLTHELAELIDDADFATLKPGATNILNASVDFETSVIQIVYDINSEITGDNDQSGQARSSDAFHNVIFTILTSVICTLMSIAICIGIFLIYKHKCNVTSRIQPCELLPTSAA